MNLLRHLATPEPIFFPAPSTDPAGGSGGGGGVGGGVFGGVFGGVSGGARVLARRPVLPIFS